MAKKGGLRSSWFHSPSSRLKRLNFENTRYTKAIYIHQLTCVCAYV